MSDLAKIENVCELSKTSLTFKRDVSKEEWTEVFNSLKQVEGCVQFWIGDCLAYRTQKWGMYNDMEGTGYNKGTLQNIKSVSEKIETSRRREDLSFTHHSEVAGLEIEKQEEFLDRAVNENLSARDLRKEIRNEKKSFEVQELPQGVFNVIYCDPPWQYSNSGLGGSAESHYPTMSTDDLCEMDLPTMSEDSVCFMWVTNPLLEDGLRLMDAWGFNYKTNFVWVKDKQTYGKLGFYVYGQHEILLIGTKGSMLPLGEKPVSIIQGKNNVHSKKPEIVYEIIEQMYPECRYVELFARNEKPGWITWGNEIKK